MRRRSSQRGFAMLVVIIIAALLAMLAGSLMQLVQGDLSMVGQARRSFEARDVAEAGAAEVLNDLDFVASYPAMDSASLSVDYPTGASNVIREGKTYTGAVRLLRIGPATESSLEQTRVLTYEVLATGEANAGAARSEVVSEVLRAVAYPRGWAPDERHYR